MIRSQSFFTPRITERENARKQLGGNIRRERSTRTMSQGTLAARAGLNVRTIAKIEAGELNVRVQTLENIRQAIGCPMSALIDIAAQPATELRVAAAHVNFLQKLCGRRVTAPVRRCL